MKLDIYGLASAERMYTYSQSTQIMGQCGCIGYLRGDFGSGQEFYTTWFDQRAEYKTDQFKADFDQVLCLCDACAENFRSTGVFFLRQVKRRHEERICDYCGLRSGTAYEVTPDPQSEKGGVK